MTSIWSLDDLIVLEEQSPIAVYFDKRELVIRQRATSPVAHTGLRRIGMVHPRSDGSSLKHWIAETGFFQFDQHQPGDGFRQISVPCGLLSAVRRPDRYRALACPHLSTKGRAVLPFNDDVAVHKGSPAGCGTNLRRSRLVASSYVGPVEGPANLRLYRRRCAGCQWIWNEPPSLIDFITFSARNSENPATNKSSPWLKAAWPSHQNNQPKMSMNCMDLIEVIGPNVLILQRLMTSAP